MIVSVMAAGVIVSVVSLVLIVFVTVLKKKCQAGKYQPEGQALHH